MPRNFTINTQELQAALQKAEAEGDWKTAAELYARCAQERSEMLELIDSVQEGLSSKLEMQAIYNLVGDKLRDTFNAQVVMISQYDPVTRRVFHHYAIENGEHLNINQWMPVDSSRATIIRTRKPFMINLQDILKVVREGRMKVVPGTKLPKTWLGVPMLVGNTAHGVVSLQNLDEENAFSQADINLLMTLTNSMTLSLENARLFNRNERLLHVLQAEMDLARNTQKSILPGRRPRKAGYDLGSLILPARAVGGDFYDFIPMDGDRLGIVIGDVSDKGLPAALFMALTFSLLRAESEKTSEPEQILLHVNHYLLKMNALGMFVTLIYGVLDYPSGVLKYARAGHVLPIVLDEGGHKICLHMDVGQPLGLFEDMRLDVQEVEIPAGGMALFFTDGLNEAEDEAGREFGFTRIAKVLQAHPRENSTTLCKLLWKAVQEYRQGSVHKDDFAVLVVKREKA